MKKKKKKKMSGEEYSDETHLLRSSNDIIIPRDENGGVSAEDDDDDDLEAQQGILTTTSRKSSISPSSRGGGGRVGAFKDLILKHLDGAGGLSGRRNSFKRLDGNRDRGGDSNRREIREHRSPVDQLRHSHHNHHESSAGIDGNDELADSAPPEWALLLLGCLLGLATGLFVAAFNKGVSFNSLNFEFSNLYDHVYLLLGCFDTLYCSRSKMVYIWK